MSFHQGNIWVSMLRWNMEDEQPVQFEASQPALEPGGEGLARFKIPKYLEVVHLLMTLRLWKLCFPLRSYGTQVESDILRGISLRRTLRSFGAVWMKSAQDLSPDQRIERGLL